MTIKRIYMLCKNYIHRRDISYYVIKPIEKECKEFIRFLTLLINHVTITLRYKSIYTHARYEI